MSTKSIQIFSIVFLSLSIISLGFISSYNNYIDSVTDQHVRLVEKINSIKANINIYDVEALKGDSSDVDNPHYRSLQQKLTALNNATPDLRYIYLLGMRDSSLFFFIDTEPNNRNFKSITDLAKPGEKYNDAPYEFYDSYFNQKEKVCKPYTDKWGSFVSVVSPLTNSKNEIIALVGADVLNENFISIYQTKTVTPILLSVVLVLVFIILFFVFGQKYIDEKNLLRKLDRIKNALNKYHESMIIVNSDYSIEFINYSAKLIIFSILNLKLDEKSTFKEIIELLNNKNFEEKIRFLFDNCTTSENKYWYSTEFQNSKILISISPILNNLDIVSQLIINIKVEKFNSKFSEKTDDFEEEKLILEHIKEVVWQVNFEFLVISVSPSLKNLTGFNNEEIVFKNMETLVNSESMLKLTNTLHNLKKVVEKKSKIEEALIVLQIKCKSGDYINVESRIIIKFNQFNEAVGFVIVMQKLNENIDALIELNETKKSIQTYFNHIPGILYRCSIDKNWTMKFMSNGCFDLTGYQVEDFIDNNVLAYNDIILPEFQEILWSKWQKVIAKTGAFEGQYQIRTANGETKWVLEKGRCVYDDNDNPIALEGIIIDISDKVKLEETVKYNEQRFRDYLESTSICSLVTDKYGNIKDFSSSLSVFLGIEKFDLFNKPIFELIEHTYLDKFVNFFEKLKFQPNIDIVLKIKVKDFEVFVSIYASKVYENEFMFYIVNNNEMIVYNRSLKKELFTFNQIITNLPLPVFIVDIKSRNIITKSEISNQINKEVNCPCGIMDNNQNINCNIVNTECLINQMLSCSDMIHSSFNITKDTQKKYYDVWVSPIYSENDKDTITQAIVTLIENTEFYQTNNKLNEASNSLNNIFNYHFQNLNYRMQRIFKIMQTDNEIERSNLYEYVLGEYQNSRFLNDFIAKKDNLNLHEIYPEEIFSKVFGAVKARRVLYKGKNVFFINELTNEDKVLLNEKSFKLLLDYAFNYTVLHSHDSSIKIIQFINDENKFEIDFKFILEELIYQQINDVTTKSFFEIFKNYKTTSQSIIDFAFLSKLCALFGVNIDFVKQKSNEVICRLMFETSVQNSANTVNYEKKNQSVAIISSDQEMLNYLHHTLEEKFEKVSIFNDYISAIKTLSNEFEKLPDIIIVDEFVNNIKASEVLLKISQKLTAETKVIMNCSCFKEIEPIEDEILKRNIQFITYPYTKTELFNFIG